MLVIFDCDGVLVDTEALNRHALVEVLRRFAIDVTNAEATVQFHGLSNWGIVERVQALWGISLGDAFIPALEAEEADLVRRYVQPIKGVRRAVEDIVDLGFATCVASNGSLGGVRERLTCAGLADLFGDRLFSAEQVARGKPFPDVFLHAGMRMGFPPTACVVIEDSEAGIQAGQAAGMRVLAFAPEADAAAGKSAGVERFADMTLLPSLLGLQDPSSRHAMQRPAPCTTAE